MFVWGALLWRPPPYEDPWKDDPSIADEDWEAGAVAATGKITDMSVEAWLADFRELQQKQRQSATVAKLVKRLTVLPASRFRPGPRTWERAQRPNLCEPLSPSPESARCERSQAHIQRPKWDGP